MKRLTRIALSFVLMVLVIVLSIFSRNSEKVFLNVNEDQPIYRVNVDEKIISLTFDINWAEKEYIYNILDILDKYNVKATFFVMGKWVTYTEENIKKLKFINDAGHEVGNHSYVHPNFTKIGGDRIKEELQKTDKIIEEIIGIKPKLFRFPSGEYNKQAFQKVKELGYTAIQWDADSVDWKELGENLEYERVMKKVKPGSILLFHNNAKYTPGNLDRIINELQSQGYKFAPVGELIYKDNYYIDEAGEQIKNK